MKRAALLLTLAVVLTGCGSPAVDDDVTALTVGDCFDELEGSEVTSVPRVDCAEEHDFEVYAVAAMADEEFPGHDATVTEAGETCSDAFEVFLGLPYDDALQGGYDFTSLYPTAESWKLGDREIVCSIAATTPDGEIRPVTGTLKGAEQ